MSTPTNARLYALYIFHVLPKKDQEPHRAVKLAECLDNSSISMWIRSKFAEFALFGCRTIAERSIPNARMKIEQQIMDETYGAFCYRNSDGLVAVVLANSLYPTRVGHDLVVQAVHQFSENYPASKWAGLQGDCKIDDKIVKQLLTHYQKPEEADKIMKLTRDVEEVKMIMLDNIDKLLERGEKLDDLIARSGDLSATARGFERSARKMRRCNCVVM